MSESKKYIPALGYDRLSGIYDQVIKLTMPENRFRQQLVQQANVQPDEKVLDFGFGTASQTILLKQHAMEATIMGVEIDPQIKSIAEEKVRKKGLIIQLDLYDGKHLPYEDETFDKVVSSLVFHQLDKEQKEIAFNELLRVLKFGGEIHIGDWGKASNPFMRIAFLGVQLLDGFKTTRDNLKGLIPKYLSNAGFVKVVNKGFINTLFGTFCFYKATKKYYDETI